MMNDLFAEIKKSLSGKRKTVILPEGTDIRYQKRRHAFKGKDL